MAEIHLITVGKLRDKNLISLEEDYKKRISPHIKFSVHEVKAKQEDLDLEEKEVMKKINQLQSGRTNNIILLTENGKQFDSPKFSKWLFGEIETHSTLILVIGGASGFSKNLRSLAAGKLSLSELTFPHQIARVLLVEQLYRAITIRDQHPYHK